MFYILRLATFCKCIGLIYRLVDSYSMTDMTAESILFSFSYFFLSRLEIPAVPVGTKSHNNLLATSSVRYLPCQIKIKQSFYYRFPSKISRIFCISCRIISKAYFNLTKLGLSVHTFYVWKSWITSWLCVLIINWRKNTQV